MLLLAGCSRTGDHTMLITAHRGASGLAPENTVIAMLKAIESGADYAELDVQETKDGVIVLMHDDSLTRTTGIPKGVWEVNSTTLRHADAGSWFSPDFAGEPVPTLDSVIQAVKSKLKLNIELKVNDHQKQLAERVLAIVHKHRFEKQCILTSFDFALIDSVRRLAPTQCVGYIFSSMPESDIFSADVDVLSVHSKLVNASFVEKAHRYGKQVHVWTVDDPKEMKRLIRLGVDSIITNRPDILKQVLNS